MQKGKFGICLPFYAILAFVLAWLGQTLLCALLLGFVIVAEKDEWTSRQTMQAFFLSLVMGIVNSVLDILNIFERIPFIGTVFDVIFGVITSIISLLILIFVIVALVRVAKGREAALPLLSKLANRAFGLVEQKFYTQAPPAAPGYPQQPPVQAPPAAYPQQPAPNAPQNPEQPK